MARWSSNDEHLSALNHASVQQNTETALHVLRFGVTIGDVTAPLSAIEFARQFEVMKDAENGLKYTHRTTADAVRLSIAEVA